MSVYLGFYDWMYYYTPCSSFDKKIERHGKKQEKTQAEETKQSSGPDSDVTQIIELLDGEFQITMINMLNTLMEKKKTWRNRGVV